MAKSAKAPAKPAKSASKAAAKPAKASAKPAAKTTKTTAKASAASAKPAAKKAASGAGGLGLKAPLTPSETLAKLVGNKPMPRTEVTKRVWDYIKKNDLQDKKNRRMINADENLKAICGTNQLSMFDLPKALNKHLK